MQCSPCERTARLRRINMCCPADPPKWIPAKPITVVWVISSWNEGEMLINTIDSLYKSIVDPLLDFRCIVVDDASADDSAEDLDQIAKNIIVIHNKKPMGIGYNINMATDMALELGADVVGVADAHMQIPEGSIEYLSDKALSETCVVCSGSTNLNSNSKFKQFGAYLVRSDNNLFAAKWMGTKWKNGIGPDGPWGKVQVPLGAFYAYSANTIKQLKSPTKRLWETPVGRWGFLLEPFSIKAWLLNIPIYVSRDCVTQHYYRPVNEKRPKKQRYPAHKEKIKNIIFGTSSVFSPKTWNKWCHGFCYRTRAVSKNERDKIIKNARAGVNRPWSSEAENELIENMPIEDVKVTTISRTTEKKG